AKDPAFRKTWLLQAMEAPSGEPPLLAVTNGKGSLFVQTLLPAGAEVRVVSGPDLYRVGDRTYPPARDTGPAPKARIEVSPSRPAADDLFLHVLTATDATVESVPRATADAGATRVTVKVGDATIAFDRAAAGGEISIGGQPGRQLRGTKP
ncbi:MAG: hypothetical protein JXP34_25840, partial [Planctomycetes bacterium]|nr:hypothetical protein [Planctomycetota bacterium]